MNRTTKNLLTILLFVSSTIALRAQTIQIKLLDGKTGRPAKGICVGTWKKDLSTDVYIRSDRNGVARLRLTQDADEVDTSHSDSHCGDLGVIDPVLEYDDLLWVGPVHEDPLCAFPQSMANSRYKELNFSTKDVIQHGVVAENTCGKVTVSPQPGEIILFVRPRKLMEILGDRQLATSGGDFR